MNNNSLTLINAEAEAIYAQHEKAAANLRNDRTLLRAMKVLNEQPEVDSQEAIDSVVQGLAGDQ